jgi:4-hydroxy-tetrahydrodipicolinate synthase
MAINHHRMVVAASRLPLVLYQAGVGSGEMAYSAVVLEALVRLPNVVGIKEGSWESARYEANRRHIKRVAPRVAVMASGDEHLRRNGDRKRGSMVSIACWCRT